MVKNMWNTFETCKEDLWKSNYKISDASCSKNALKQIIDNLIEKYSEAPFSTLKTRVIETMIDAVNIDILPDDIFATHFEHYGLMSDLMGVIYRNEEFTKVRSAKAMEYEERKVFSANRDFGHVSPDWDYIIERGIVGIIKDLEYGLEKYSDEPEKKLYFEDRLTVYRAINKFLIRFADVAKKSGSAKGNFISENLRNLTINPPSTLAEGIQLILIFYAIQNAFDTVTIRSLGGLDHLLYPLYKNDLESGKYTKEQLVEIIKYFLWDIKCMRATANLPFYIGGVDKNGDAPNDEFTLLLLECYNKLDIYDPKIHVMYNENMSKKVLRFILQTIREGKSSFVFINTPLASKALENIGVSKEDAKRVTVYGCYETAAEGTEVPCTCGGMINLASAIDLVMQRNNNPETFERFYNEVIAELKKYTTLCMDTIAGYERFYGNICPSLIMSPTYQNSRENGVDLYCGGAKYNNTSIVGAGLATLVDSLVVIKNVVYEEKIKTLTEFKEILKSNWNGEEKFRLTVMKKYSKFGNNLDEADVIALDIYKQFSSMINKRANGRGGVFRCGLFSVDWRFWMGEKTGATPDGRHAGEPISKNLAACIGQDKNGMTAYLETLTKFDGTKTPDGYVADVVLHSSAVKDEEGMVAFEALLHTFMSKGGFAVHFNILSPDTLINAQKEPTKYQNLQIRLCGWNVRFVDLNRFEQDEFIKNSQNKM